jgi:hypothetical protein
MKKAVAVVLASCVTVGAASATELEQRTQASRAAIKGFMESLQGELVQAMEQGGPVNAIEVCKRVAPGIAEAKSTETGMHVARTSLKVRNPDNAPDEWEQAVLESFEARKAAGEPVEALDHAEIVTINDQQAFRYMRAIPTGSVCLACHGAELDSNVSAKLDALYPEDQARGFSEGDIRGAFTVLQMIER